MNGNQKVWVVYTEKENHSWTDYKGNTYNNYYSYQESFFDKDKAVACFKSLCKGSNYKQVFLKEIDLEKDTVVDLSKTFDGNVLQIAGSITHLFDKFPQVIRTSSRMVDNQNITISVSVQQFDSCKTAFDIIFDKVIKDNKELFNNNLTNIKVMVNSKKYKLFKNI